MKKWVSCILFVFLLASCGQEDSMVEVSNDAVTSSKELSEVETQATEVVSIEEVKVALYEVDEDNPFSIDIDNYHQYGFELLKHISSKHHFPIKSLEFSTDHDILLAFQTGEVDLLLFGNEATQVNYSESMGASPLLTYSYWGGQYEFFNGDSTPKMTQAFLVRPDRNDIYTILNQEILNMKKTGELDEFEQSYFGSLAPLNKE